MVDGRFFYVSSRFSSGFIVIFRQAFGLGGCVYGLFLNWIHPSTFCHMEHFFPISRFRFRFLYYFIHYSRTECKWSSSLFDKSVHQWNKMKIEWTKRKKKNKWFYFLPCCDVISIKIYFRKINLLVDPWKFFQWLVLFPYGKTLSYG